MEPLTWLMLVMLVAVVGIAIYSAVKPLPILWIAVVLLGILMAISVVGRLGH